MANQQSKRCDVVFGTTPDQHAVVTASITGNGFDPVTAGTVSLVTITAIPLLGPWGLLVLFCALLAGALHFLAGPR